MADVQWIKITTSMFQDEKIDFIESLPEADSILIIWIKLLTQAGKTNQDGFIYLTEKIPFTVEMLSHKFRRPLNTVKLAMETLHKLEMIEYDEEGFLKIVNWDKHQNIEGLDKIREQNRLRQAKYRERNKRKELTEGVTQIVTLHNGTDKEEDKEEDKEKDIDKIIDVESKPVKEKKPTPTKNDKIMAILDPFNFEDEVVETIFNFIEMRKEIKASMTMNAIKLLVNKLVKLSMESQMQIKILEQSIMNSYKGIFEVKDSSWKTRKEQIANEKIRQLDDQSSKFKLEAERLAKEGLGF